MTKQIELYKTKRGKIPFLQWLNRLKDKMIKIKIKRRLDRLSLGDFGDYKLITKELCELRIHVGPGYRIYFACYKQDIVVLLIGGDKKSQKRDVKKAGKYWVDFKERVNED